MICNTCGRHTQNEEANFCEYCGSSFREHRVISDFAVPGNGETGQQAVQQVGQQVGQNIAQEATEKPITFLHWLGLYAVMFIPMFIPFIGWIVPLVMLFVWAFANNTPVSKKNWSRATLIFLLVYFIVAVFALVSMVNNPIFQELMGTFNLSKF